MKALIQKLVETAAPSGFESPMRQVIRQEIEGLADEITVDAMGNLIARKGNAGDGGRRMVLMAHVDEIGVTVTHVDDHGFARFIALGGVNPRTCPGARVRFLNGATAVIGVERTDDPGRVPGFEQLYLDFGVTQRSDCPVQVGDEGIFDRPFTDLGKRLISKAMDNRIGVAVLIETLRQAAQGPALPNTVFFVFTTQEEVGTRGATTAAYHLDPDLGLAIDVTGTGDTPRSRRMAVRLGDGPAIKIRDQGMISDPQVVAWMIRTAEAASIPYQREILELGYTDGRPTQTTRAGVPVGALSIPCRYIHSPSEMVDLDDVQNSVRLLLELVRQPVRLEE